MKKINIVGVPEHFNLPWHLCIENGEFECEGIDLNWTDVPEGTGKMCEMLRNGETDMAVILSEGIVKDIHQGNPSKIVQIFVETPLIWGIHVAHNSKFQKIAELEYGRIAISRMGSGSHLMAIVNAQNQGWNPNNLKFEIINTLDGAVEALQKGKADYFMWERFMTQPLVDNQIFRRIAECPTPWPCFVIAVREEILQKHPQTIERILEIINTTTREFKQIPSIDRTLASKYHQKLEDIQLWLDQTRWSQNIMDDKTLNIIQNELLALKIIQEKATFATLVHRF